MSFLQLDILEKMYNTDILTPASFPHIVINLSSWHDIVTFFSRFFFGVGDPGGREGERERKMLSILLLAQLPRNIINLVHRPDQKTFYVIPPDNFSVQVRDKEAKN